MNILVVDIGGTSVKILATGQKTPRWFHSGPGLAPEHMASKVLEDAKEWEYDVVSIGYPGPVVSGRPMEEPRNLGPGWVSFDYEGAFGLPVKMMNDAAMQALGSYEGGRMFFMGLGTGVGTALIVDGAVLPMELAHLPYKKGTYEDYLGIRGLNRTGLTRWRRHVYDCISRLTTALQIDDMVIGGGNVRKLKDLPSPCRRGHNDNAFRGGFLMWDEPGHTDRATMRDTHPASPGSDTEDRDVSRCLPANRRPAWTKILPSKHGLSFPLGATIYPEGVNFSIFSKQSEAVELLLFDHVDDPKPSRVIEMDRRTNRTYHYRHVFVPGVREGQHYGYRVHGPFDPDRGLRFDPGKVLLDPYGRSVARPSGYDREAARQPGDNTATSMKSVVTDPTAYDWEGDLPLLRPFVKTVLYEMHVSGFTRHPGSGVQPDRRGTYAGLIEKIPYLKDLGVSAVELLPVFAFDEQDGPPGLSNYWGYSPVSFFAPHEGYSSRRDPLGVLDEFRDMVKALHRAGIEVLLDVVYNHTAEAGHDGPTFCFRGLSNEAYYILEKDKSRYADYTGCGNTMNANEPVCRRMIIDSLRYWVRRMHVDGFRFDLASILSRDRRGHPMPSPPVLWDIESDPVLANAKLIAEAWDAAGLYQVGSFVGDSWKEWNGKFRDDVRAFLKGDNGTARAVGFRLSGSPDLYLHKEREPEQSVNFVTCHDGFTLNDLVSYNWKHNETNLEQNRDGANENLSWNCGVEGPSDDPQVERLRNRQVKNFLALTLLSVGTPMLLMGDEVRRTQGGNNNVYCQNNEISWMDWALLDRYGDVHRFCKLLIALRMNREFSAERLDMTLNELLSGQPVQWHGTTLGSPDWSSDSHTLAATVNIPGGRMMLHLMVNAYWEPLFFEIPRTDVDYGPWRRNIDTFLEPPEDICAWTDAPVVEGLKYSVEPRSLVLLSSSHRSAVPPDGMSGAS